MQFDTKPAPLEIDLNRAALVVIDMQNAFCCKGGMLDLAGLDISGAANVIQSVKQLITAARSIHLPIVYLQAGYSADLSDSGGPTAPNWHKELALRLMEQRQTLRGKLLVEGTWDVAIVDELKPRPEDLVIVKTRYSGFARTRLDEELRKRNLQYLFFSGTTTNVCVESTLRDAFMFDYWPILVADATMQAGPREMFDATVFNVESYFGWTIGCAALVQRWNEIATTQVRSAAE